MIDTAADPGSALLDWTGLTSGLSNLLGGAGGGGVDRLGEAAHTTPGLPQEGTLAHTVTLGLYRLQQGLSGLFNRGPASFLAELAQPAVDHKVGEIADLPAHVTWSKVRLGPF